MSTIKIAVVPYFNHNVRNILVKVKVISSFTQSDHIA